MGGVSVNHGNLEDLQQFLINVGESFFVCILQLIAPANLVASRAKKFIRIKAPCLFNFRIICLDGTGKRRLPGDFAFRCSFVSKRSIDSENAIDIRIVGVIVEFISYKQGNQKTGSNTKGKSPNLDRRVHFLLG